MKKSTLKLIGFSALFGVFALIHTGCSKEPVDGSLVSQSSTGDLSAVTSSNIVIPTEGLLLPVLSMQTLPSYDSSNSVRSAGMLDKSLSDNDEAPAVPGSGQSVQTSVSDEKETYHHSKDFMDCDITFEDLKGNRILARIKDKDKNKDIDLSSDTNNEAAFTPTGRFCGYKKYPEFSYRDKSYIFMTIEEIQKYREIKQRQYDHYKYESNDSILTQKIIIDDAIRKFEKLKQNDSQ